MKRRTTFRDSCVLGKKACLRGREFGDQVHTFSCLSVLHNAVVAWNMLQIGEIVTQLRAEGHQIDDETLSHVTPLVRRHINPLAPTTSTWTDAARRQPCFKPRSLTEIFGWM